MWPTSAMHARRDPPTPSNRCVRAPRVNNGSVFPQPWCSKNGVSGKREAAQRAFHDALARRGCRRQDPDCGKRPGPSGHLPCSQAAASVPDAAGWQERPAAVPQAAPTAFPQGLIMDGKRPTEGAGRRGENPHRPTPVPGPQTGGSLPSTSGTPCTAWQWRWPVRNRKVASNIGKSRRAPEKHFLSHTHPIV